MSWIGFALLSALFVSIASIVEKQTLFYEHSMEYSAVLAVIVGIISLPFFFLVDFSSLTLRALVLLLTTSLLGAVGTFFIARSSRHLEISTVSPLLVFGPAITTVLAYFVLDEKISIVQGVGLIILMGGAYILELHPDSKVFDPLKIFAKSRFIHLLLAGIVIGAISSLIDRTLLFSEGLTVFTYLAIVTFLQALFFILLLTIYHDGLAGIKHGFQTAGLPVFFIAALTVTHRFLQAGAVQLAFVGLALTLKRTSSIFTALIGGKLFHEQNVGRKVFACLIMVTGVLLIVF
ncbi:MAG: hypothetical protein NVSMB66_4230 [Candidatus Doudnabacteria bacterium]